MRTIIGMPAGVCVCVCVCVSVHHWSSAPTVIHSAAAVAGGQCPNKWTAIGLE